MNHLSRCVHLPERLKQSNARVWSPLGTYPYTDDPARHSIEHPLGVPDNTETGVKREESWSCRHQRRPHRRRLGVCNIWGWWGRWSRQPERRLGGNQFVRAHGREGARRHLAAPTSWASESSRVGAAAWGTRAAGSVPPDRSWNTEYSLEIDIHGLDIGLVGQRIYFS
jgi:hypothetical protein